MCFYILPALKIFCFFCYSLIILVAVASSSSNIKGIFPDKSNSYILWFLCEQVQTWPFSCLHLPSMAVNYVSFIAFLCHWRSSEKLYNRSFSSKCNQSPNCWLRCTVELVTDRRIWSLVMDQILFPCTMVLDILEYVSLAPAKYLSLQRQYIIYAQWFIHASLVSFTEFHSNIKIKLNMCSKKKKRAKKLAFFFNYYFF